MFHIDDSAQFLLLLVLAGLLYLAPIIAGIFLIGLLIKLPSNLRDPDDDLIERNKYKVYLSYWFKLQYWTVINVNKYGALIVESERGEIRTMTSFDRNFRPERDNDRTRLLTKRAREKYGEPCSTDIGIGSKPMAMYKEG